MNSNHNLADNWDLGLSDLIEETPVTVPANPKQFKEVEKADGAQVYMLRQKPSWE